MKAKIFVLPKPTVLDPQGQAIHHALENLGFEGIQDVRQGKYFEIELKPGASGDMKAALKNMCEKLLANTVIETYHIEAGE